MNKCYLMKSKGKEKYLTLVNRLKLDMKDYEVLRDMCHASKNLYNLGLYHVRQLFFKEKKFLTYNKLYHEIKEEDAYKAMHSQCGQQTLMKVEQDMMSFFGALEYAREHGNSDPVKPPRYKKKDGFFNIFLQNNSFQVKGKEVLISLPKKVKKVYHKKYLHFDLPKHLLGKKIKEVQIIPCYEGCFFQLGFVYIDDKDYSKVKINEDNFLGIDLGLDNLLTMVDSVTNSGNIISGKTVKSINQQYNKEVARLKSIAKKRNGLDVTNKIIALTVKRNRRIKDIFHKVSRQVVDHCVGKNISEIIIGHNKEWKQEINLGSKTNQKFVQIPHRKLINYINYKAKKHNIKVLLNEESYTSKCDALALEEIEKHESYLGRRKKRGLFESSTKKLINADVNGALNIIRKCKGDFVDFWILQLASSGLVFRPRTWSATSRSFVL